MNEKEIEKKIEGTAGLVKVVFDYPFDIGLPDMYFPVVLEERGEVGMIKIKRLEGIQIFDKGKILRASEVSGKKEIMVVELLAETNEKQELVGLNEVNNPAFHHIISNMGKSSYPWFYSKVEVVFCVTDIKAAWSNRENSTFINDMTMRLFNKYLLAYRDATTDIFNKYITMEADLALYKELYVSAFSEEENLLPTTKIITSELLEKRDFVPFFNIPNKNGTNPFPVVQGSITTPLKNNAQKKEATKEQAVRFLHASAMPASIPVFNQVLLSSMEKLVMDNDPRMTIVDLDTAVEMTIVHYLFGFLLEEGKTIKEVVDLFDDELKASWDLGRNGYLTTMNRLARLEEFFNKKFVLENKPPITIKNTDEYKEWNKLVRKRRNGAVHAWGQYTEAQAKESFAAAQKFIRYLQKIGDEFLIKKT